MASQTPEQIVQNFQDLDFTQGIRKQIIEAVLPDAIKNKDPEMLDKAMKAVDGMDKQTLGKLKINEKEKENQTKENESAALAGFLVTLADRRSDRVLPQRGQSDVTNRNLPDAKRPQYDPSIRDAVPGNETTAEFNARMEGAST